MDTRAITAGLLLFSSATILWLAPRMLQQAGAVAMRQDRLVLPAPDAGDPAGRSDTRCADAVRVLTSVPHPPIIAGGRVYAAALNGVPVASCSFQTPGTCSEVMNFYLTQLDAHGWRDLTAGSMKPPRGSATGDIPDDVEKYDELLSTQALLVKGGDTLTLSLEPARLRRCAVAITIARTPDLAGLWESAMRRSEQLARSDASGAWLESSAERPGGATTTRFYNGRGSPDDLIAVVATDMRSQGWTPVLAPRDHRPGVKACMFMKPGGGWAMATARQEPRGNLSRAVLYVQ